MSDREIKQRAWNIEKEEMIYSEDFSASYWGDIVLERSDDWINSSFGGRFKIMRYTGLKDKNGKEIYEGDIVEFQNLESSDEPLVVPEMTPENLELIVGIGDGEWEVKRNQYSNIEVIGDKYQNPELLNED